MDNLNSECGHDQNWSRRIREARSSDINDLIATYASFFPEAEADPGFGLNLYRTRPRPSSSRQYFSKLLKKVKSGRVVFRVAEVDGHVVGSCEVEQVVPGGPLDNRGSLALSVKKEFRSKGIGTALLSATLEACRGKFELIELDVYSNNKGAINLYRRFGFKKYGHLPRAAKRGGQYLDFDYFFLEL